MQATNQIFRRNRPLHQQPDPELFIIWKHNQNTDNTNWNQNYIETKPTFAESSGLAVIQQNTDYIVSCLHCISTYNASPLTMYSRLQFPTMNIFNFPQHRNYVLTIIYQNTCHSTYLYSFQIKSNTIHQINNDNNLLKFNKYNTCILNHKNITFTTPYPTPHPSAKILIFLLAWYLISDTYTQ